MAENEEISIVYSGMLHKKGGVQGSWEHRFFVLKSDGQMRYYSQHDPSVSGLDGDPDAMKGIIHLDTASRCISNADAKLSEPNKGLTIVCRDRVWSLIASSEEERDKWIREIASQMRLKNRFMVRMQGSLHKQGGVVKSWKLRHFVVGFDHVFYFNTKADFDKFATLAGDDAENIHSSVLDIALGVIPLRSSFITRSRGDGCVDGRSFCFEINTADRTYIMSAANDAEVLTWMDQCIEASKADDLHTSRSTNLLLACEASLSKDELARFNKLVQARDQRRVERAARQANMKEQHEENSPALPVAPTKAPPPPPPPPKPVQPITPSKPSVAPPLPSVPVPTHEDLVSNAKRATELEAQAQRDAEEAERKMQEAQAILAEKRKSLMDKVRSTQSP